MIGLVIKRNLYHKTEFYVNTVHTFHSLRMLSLMFYLTGIHLGHTLEYTKEQTCSKVSQPI